MKEELFITRLLIGDICLEMDINNEPRVVMKDETGIEWVLDMENTAWGFMPKVTKKENSWYFNEKNRTKEPKSFFSKRKTSH